MYSKCQRFDVALFCLQTFSRTHLEMTPPRCHRAALRPSTDLTSENSAPLMTLWGDMLTVNMATTRTKHSNREFDSDRRRKVWTEGRWRGEDTVIKMCFTCQTLINSNTPTVIFMSTFMSVRTRRAIYRHACTHGKPSRDTNTHCWRWRQRFEQHCVFAVFYF